ncbi:Kinase, CMGC CDK [Spironucleus salmonicida]|uniref:Kinase, CMGC CDK n=1 Tax=Spironucleus salmonicida TaxID=348837 RepID=V6LSP8_9EUKA|nr:Kinase, CMGC CDK [Spironucleus salmonicida]|eukprot:EST47273.1 Kinase, CMGC CDK [Spironucleus salmonicida]
MLGYSVKQIVMNFTPEIMLQKLTILTTLGSGSYSTVFHAIYQKNDVVAKKFTNSDEKSLEKINREATLLVGMLNFPIFLQFSAIINCQGSRFILTQHHGSPLDLGQKFTRIQLKSIFFQLFYAISILNVLKLTHRDVKPENILLSRHVCPCLIDFGLMLPVTKNRQKAGTKQYQSPENFAIGISHQNSDVYSLGIIFCNIALKSKIALSSSKLDQLKRFKQILGEEFSQFYRQNVILTDEEIAILGVEKQIAVQQRVAKCKDFTHLTPESISMISLLLVCDPEKRISAIEALNLEYFDEVRSEYSQLKYINGNRGKVELDQNRIIQDFKANFEGFKGDIIV